MLTNLQNMYNKKYTMEVAQDVRLTIEVLNEKNVLYQFEGLDDAGQLVKDLGVVTALEVEYDDIEGVSDYSFTDGIATRFFLFQFEPLEEEVLDVTFVSVWDGGYEIESKAKYDVQWRNVFEIETVEATNEEGEEVENLEESYILLPTGEKIEVVDVGNGYRTL